MVTTRGKGGWEEVEEGKEGVNGVGRRFDSGGGHTMQCTDAAAQNCMLEACMTLLTNAAPINLIEKNKQTLSQAICKNPI